MSHKFPLSLSLITSMHTHTTVLRPSWILSGTTRVSRHQKGEISLDLLEQEGSGISWAICKCAPWSRHVTTPASHQLVFYKPDALSATHPTVSKHWRLRLMTSTWTVTVPLFCMTSVPYHMSYVILRRLMRGCLTLRVDQAYHCRFRPTSRFWWRQCSRLNSRLPRHAGTWVWHSYSLSFLIIPHWCSLCVG